MTKPTYWRSVSDLLGEDEVSPSTKAYLDQRVPDHQELFGDPLSRRRFMQLMGASVAFAGAVGCRYEQDHIAPEAVRATSELYREIPVRWDPVLIPGVAGYVVESATSESGPFVQRAILSDRGVLEWVDHGTPEAPLGDDAQRFYRLRSFAHDGRVSRLVSLTTSATTGNVAVTAAIHGVLVKAA